jgi:hypothetical protein
VVAAWFVPDRRGHWMTDLENAAIGIINRVFVAL